MEMMLKEFKTDMYDGEFATDEMATDFSFYTEGYELKEPQVEKLYEYFNKNWERV